jgi:LAO/AO transport system kinase
MRPRGVAGDPRRARAGIGLSRPGVAMHSFEPALTSEDQTLVDGVLARQRRALAKAITLMESTRPDHRERAQALLHALLPHSGNSLRLGVSGVPGVGKSTFIEALGLHLIDRGQRVAVLAVDPSSSISGGSILGDKTRMEQLSTRDEAYIRPSPTAGSLGGVADKTREAMLLCEAAGFDVIIVETVGVGQSETAVAGMTDVFCLLQLPNAGDDLQAIKKGIVELADIVVINKADIDPLAAEFAASQMRSAMTLLQSASSHWQPPVLKLSAARREGIAEFWQKIADYQRAMSESGELAGKRRHQALAWMWALIESGLRERFRDHPGVQAMLPELTAAVEDASVAPAVAAHRLLGLMNRYF